MIFYNSILMFRVVLQKVLITIRVTPGLSVTAGPYLFHLATVIVPRFPPKFMKKEQSNCNRDAGYVNEQRH